jgi:hypothetical protein
MINIFYYSIDSCLIIIFITLYFDFFLNILLGTNTVRRLLTLLIRCGILYIHDIYSGGIYDSS